MQITFWGHLSIVNMIKNVVADWKLENKNAGGESVYSLMQYTYYMHCNNIVITCDPSTVCAFN